MPQTDASQLFIEKIHAGKLADVQAMLNNPELKIDINYIGKIQISTYQIHFNSEIGTPLSQAVLDGHENIVEELFKRGASVESAKSFDKLIDQFNHRFCNAINAYFFRWIKYEKPQIFKNILMHAKDIYPPYPPLSSDPHNIFYLYSPVNSLEVKNNVKIDMQNTLSYWQHEALLRNHVECFNESLNYFTPNITNQTMKDYLKGRTLKKEEVSNAVIMIDYLVSKNVLTYGRGHDLKKVIGAEVSNDSSNNVIKELRIEVSELKTEIHEIKETFNKKLNDLTSQNAEMLKLLKSLQKNGAGLTEKTEQSHKLFN